MGIDSAAFKAWASAFEKRSAYRGTKNELEDAGGKSPIKATLDELLKMEGAFASEDLRLNAVYACYQASMALTLQNTGAERRKTIDRGLAALKVALPALEKVRDLVDKNPEAVALALGFTPVLDLNIKNQNVPGGVDDGLRILRLAMRKLTKVSQLAKSNPNFKFLDMSYDCMDGPFLFFNRIEDRKRASGPPMAYRKLVENGLIFHLTYLFRYFTAEKLPSDPGDTLFRGNELCVQGPMIKNGKPSQDLVAHLFNATFEVPTQKISIAGHQVRQRLKDLTAERRSSMLVEGQSSTAEAEVEQLLKTQVTDKVAAMKMYFGISNFDDAFEHLEFVGWPAVE